MRCKKCGKEGLKNTLDPFCPDDVFIHDCKPMSDLDKLKAVLDEIGVEYAHYTDNSPDGSLADLNDIVFPCHDHMFSLHFDKNGNFNKKEQI